MEEIWKDIKDYEGYYQVSNLGRVKSLERDVICNNGLHTLKERVLKPKKTKTGYLLQPLSKEGIVKSVYVHRLVAEAFIPNPDNLPEINHKSECKTENFVWVNPDGTVDTDKSNLEWCTHQYNIRYGTAIERGKKKKSKTVLQYSLDGVFIMEYNCAYTAFKETGIYNIGKCCNGIFKTAGGFRWEYK